MIAPVEMPVISSYFGERVKWYEIQSNENLYETHYGIDLYSENKNFTVYNSLKGKVIALSKDKSYIMIFTDKEQFTVTYKHIEPKPTLKINSNVNEGETLGKYLNQGTGAHLHFMIKYKNEGYINPLDLFKYNNIQYKQNVLLEPTQRRNISLKFGSLGAAAIGIIYILKNLIKFLR